MDREQPIYGEMATSVPARNGFGRLLRRIAAFRACYGAAVIAVARGSAAAAALLVFSSGDTAPGQDLDCLALNIYFEARGEPEAGRRAVAHVVLNRVDDRRWPANPCAVIAEGWPEAGRKCQFSWYCDGHSDVPRADASWRDARRLAELVYWGRSKDPTGGAFWYHADYVSPLWSKHLRRGPKIGHHIFYYDPGASGGLAKHPL